MRAFLVVFDFIVVHNITGTYLVEMNAMDRGSSTYQVEPGTREAGHKMRCTAMENTASKMLATVTTISDIVGRPVRRVF